VPNAFRFDSEENQYSLGLEFDGPLNRLNERNGYRLAQLAYQQQRRNYMAVEDGIVNSVRLNLRQLRNNRFNFQIARQQLITATRQVDEAQLFLRQQRSTDSSATQDLLQALEVLRNAKISLIGNWIDYETSRIALFVDLELLNLDENGVWINERENFGRFNTTETPNDNSTDSDGIVDADQPSTSTDDIPQPEFEEAVPEEAADQLP